MESQIKFDMNVKKALIVDAILLALLIVVFLGGLYVGKYVEFNKQNDFYKDYINSQCQCKSSLVEKDGQMTWEDSLVLPFDFTNQPNNNQYNNNE